MQRYLILTLRTEQFDPSVIEPHYAHLDRLRELGVLELFGPFADKSGGAYLIRAQDMDEARAVAHADPVHVSGSSKVTVYEWNAKECVPA
ncbi:MAG TPA: YciI family protein [Rhodanobacteraceae bacterium]|nr:YciI family protein [Rhodanobacteraceae bacterium]